MSDSPQNPRRILDRWRGWRSRQYEEVEEFRALLEPPDRFAEGLPSWVFRFLFTNHTQCIYRFFKPAYKHPTFSLPKKAF